MVYTDTNNDATTNSKSSIPEIFHQVLNLHSERNNVEGDNECRYESVEQSGKKSAKPLKAIYFFRSFYSYSKKACDFSRLCTT